MEFRDYYKILGVAKDAEAGEIKRAYRKLARKYHPDVNTTPEAEAKFKDVSEAYEVLKDPERRAAYDQLGTEGAAAQGGFRPPPDWEGGFSFTGGGPEGGEAFSDFFESLFRRRGRGGPFGHAPGEQPGGPWGGQPGGAWGGESGGRGGGRAGGRGGMRGADRHARLQVAIEDAYRGASRVLTLREPELAPDGTVQLRDRSVTVEVPKGILEGQHLRLAGQGMPPPGGTSGGGVPGDLFLEVSFAPHPVYRADGRDLYLELPVAPWEAALGGKVALPAPGGRIALTIPANARSGQTLRLRGKGLPGQGGQPAGDIYATLRIVNPKVTTEEARRLFEQMAREVPFDPRAGLGGG